MFSNDVTCFINEYNCCVINGIFLEYFFQQSENVLKAACLKNTCETGNSAHSEQHCKVTGKGTKCTSKCQHFLNQGFVSFLRIFIILEHPETNN